MKICEAIGEANQADIIKAYDSLIDQWLPGSEQTTVYSDPNATLDFGTCMTPLNDESDKELVLPINYMDASITRIVHVLRSREPELIARMLVAKLHQVVLII